MILGIGSDWETLGTIMLDIHQVQIGEARLHEGLTTYYRRDDASSLSSSTPFSSTEVTSLGKIATFIFKYRPMGKPFSDHRYWHIQKFLTLLFLR